MSGNQPISNDDERPDDAADLYGSPKDETARSKDVADKLEPLGFVEPLAIDEEESAEEFSLDVLSDVPAGDADGPGVIRLDDDEPAFDAPEDGPADAEFDAPAPLELRLKDEPEPEPSATAPSASLDTAGPEEAIGNRPAEGARVVSVSEVFSEEFMGAEGASDFLGLDTDFDPTPITDGGGGGSAGAGAELDLREAPTTAVATAEPEEGYGAPISPPDADAEYLAAADGAEDEFDGDADLDGEFAEDLLAEPAPRSRRGLMVAGAFALGLGAVALFTFGPGLFGGEGDPAPAVEVAQATPSKPAPTNAAQPGDTPAQPEVTPEPRPVEDFASGGPAPIDPAAGSGAEPGAETVATEPTDLVAEPAPDAGAGDPLDPSATIEGAGEPAVDLSAPLTLEEFLAETQDPDSFYAANASLLDLVWHGENVPVEAIAASSRILTPSVGNVRVHMASADVFEGRLFGVGENKVWVDMEMGRIGLDGRSVDRIERLPDAIPLEALNVSDVGTGERVRARVAGGVIYGRVRSQTGNTVTLVTDSGARITLEDPVLEPVGNRKSVVLKL